MFCGILLFLEVSVTFLKLDTTYKSKGMLSRHNMTLTTEVYQEGTPCCLESVLLSPDHVHKKLTYLGGAEMVKLTYQSIFGLVMSGNTVLELLLNGRWSDKPL